MYSSDTVPFVGDFRYFSIDAIARVSRAALETIALCPSAVLRASLMAEAAKLLNLPVAALEADFAKVQEAVRREQGRSQGRASAPAPVRPAPPAVAPAAPRPPAPRPAQPAPSSAGGWDEPPPDFYIDVEPPPGLEEVAPAVWPVAWDAPSPLERALCEFLLSNEGDADVAKTAAAYLPDAVLRHGLTRKVVAAWRDLVAGASEALGTLRGALEEPERAWLDKLIMGKDGAALSEVSVGEQFEKLLRQVWMEAVRKRQGELPAASSPETDRQRLAYSATIRQLQRAPWSKAAALMASATLA